MCDMHPWYDGIWSAGHQTPDRDRSPNDSLSTHVLSDAPSRGADWDFR